MGDKNESNKTNLGGKFIAMRGGRRELIELGGS